MKKLFLFGVFCAGLTSIHAQINTDNSVSAEDAVAAYFLSNGVFVDNVTFSGGSDQIGSFDCVDCNLGLESGLILATGEIGVITGPNNGSGTTLGGGNFGAGDPDLEMLIPDFALNDASILEFDFIATGDSLAFDFVFGSEEYLEFVNSSFNDVFGFFISGPNIEGPFSNGAVNIALVPETSEPISINTINDGTNMDYFVDNTEMSEDETQIQMDGFTVVMVAAIGQLTIGETYHIKLGIADAGDSAFDSVVCLSDDSFVQFCSDEVNFMPEDCLVSTNNFDFEYTLDCGVINLESIAEMNIVTTGCYWDMGDDTIIEGCMGMISHEYDEPGTYEVKLIYEYGDFEAMAIKDILISDLAPATPIIQAIGDNLELTNWDGVSTIQWLVDGEAIEGANAELLENPGLGVYTVTMANGCLSISEGFLVTNIHHHGGHAVRVFPNPSKGNITIQSEEQAWLTVFDALGQIVMQEFLNTATADLQIEGQGWYLLQITDVGGNISRLPLIVE